MIRDDRFAIDLEQQQGVAPRRGTSATATSFESFRTMAASATDKPSSAALLPALLLAGCLGLGWVVYQQLMASPAPRPLPVAAGPAEPLPELPQEVPFVMPPADEFASVLERPLFSPTRRPPSEAAPVFTVTQDPLDLELTGVIGSGGQRTAIFRPKAVAPVETARSKRRRQRVERAKRTPQVSPAPASIQLTEGDDYKGWKLEQIEVDSALFVRGEEETWLEISFDVAAPAQPPRRRARNDDEDDDGDDDNREVTPEERQWIKGVLDGEGCSEADEMSIGGGLFEVDDAKCNDGKTYDFTLDRDYTILTKERDE
jgi:hypothetical protein